MITQAVFLIFSLILTLLFFLYGFNFYYLRSTARKYKTPPAPAVKTLEERPSIAVHLPVYNEKYVICRLIDACSKMAAVYGRDKVNIVIIDDSNDDTVGEVDRVAAEYRARQFHITVLRRAGREGFKAGALQLALNKAREEYIAIFDADFIPPPDFLVRTVPHFLENEKLGIIQSRWTHLNRDYNLLTKAIALSIDVHFFLDQTARNAAACFQNFNGSGGLLRCSALREAGGWQWDTLSEDLDASYRIQLRGYSILYLKDLQIPGEVPLTVPSFKKQQGRWACGTLRTARKLLPGLLSKPNLRFNQRLQAFFHLTGYMVHPLMFASFILASLATLLTVDTFRINTSAFTMILDGQAASLAQMTPQVLLRDLTWGILGITIILCTASVWISPLAALKMQHISVRKNLSTLTVLFLLGAGISLSNTIEVGKALLTNHIYEFKRTPKYAVLKNRDDWRGKRYQVPLEGRSFLELGCLILGAASMVMAVQQSNYGVLLILAPYTAAYAFVFILTVWQSRKEVTG